MASDTLTRPDVVDLPDLDNERSCDQCLPPDFRVHCNRPAAWLYTMACCGVQETACEACHKRFNAKNFLDIPIWRCSHCHATSWRRSAIIGRMVRL